MFLYSCTATIYIRQFIFSINLRTPC